MKNLTVKANRRRYTFHYLKRHQDKPIVKALLAGHYYELEMLNFIKKRYGRGGFYLDIGACLGTHSIFFARECRASAVWAYEPQPSLAFCMNESLIANRVRGVKLFEMGVGTRKRIMYAEGSELNEKGIGSPVVIGQIAGLPEAPKFIKIDVDGMEREVLAGLHGLFVSYRPPISIEETPATERAISDLLVSRGYKKIGCFNSTPTAIYEHKV